MKRPVISAKTVQSKEEHKVQHLRVIHEFHTIHLLPERWKLFVVVIKKKTGMATQIEILTTLESDTDGDILCNVGRTS